jgi:hypothetical protein
MDAAAVAADDMGSGMHSLLKCGWVVAKVSDFGLSLCVQPEETHVSSVHAVSTVELECVCEIEGSSMAGWWPRCLTLASACVCNQKNHLLSVRLNMVYCP